MANPAGAVSTWLGSVSLSPARSSQGEGAAGLRRISCTPSFATPRAAPAGRQPRVARPNGPPPAYDAVAEDWFDDLAAMGAAFASPESQAVLADAPNFLDMSRLQVLT